MLLIPAIDLKDGKCVRLQQGDMNVSTTFGEDPAAMARRWLDAGCFEEMVNDLRALLRMHAGRGAQPSAAILDSRTLQSTPESGARAGYDGAKRRKGSKVHAAVDTLGHLLALHVTPASE